MPFVPAPPRTEFLGDVRAGAGERRDSLSHPLNKAAVLGRAEQDDSMYLHTSQGKSAM